MTRIGLLSDSHGRAATTRKAVALLQAHGVDLLIHLGDVGGVDVIDALLVPAHKPDSILEAHLVFGNVDWDADDLERYAHAVGVKVHQPVGLLTIDSKVVAFTHGHEPQAIDQALSKGADYLCMGHTHRTRNEKEGRVRIVNPGALFRAPDYTVAILDPSTDRVEFLTLPDPDRP